MRSAATDQYIRTSGAEGSPAADLAGLARDAVRADARVVVHRDGPVDAAQLTALTDRLAKLDGVSEVAPPQVSADGDTALVSVQYDIPVTDFEGSAGVDGLRSATAPLERAGYQVDLGGQVPENISAPSGTAGR